MREWPCRSGSAFSLQAFSMTLANSGSVLANLSLHVTPNLTPKRTADMASMPAGVLPFSSSGCPTGRKPPGLSSRTTSRKTGSPSWSPWLTTSQQASAKTRNRASQARSIVEAGKSGARSSPANNNCTVSSATCTLTMSMQAPPLMCASTPCRSVVMCSFPTRNRYPAATSDNATGNSGKTSSTTSANSPLHSASTLGLPRCLPCCISTPGVSPPPTTGPCQIFRSTTIAALPAPSPRHSSAVQSTRRRLTRCGHARAISWPRHASPSSLETSPVSSGFCTPLRLLEQPAACVAAPLPCSS